MDASVRREEFTGYNNEKLRFILTIRAMFHT